MNREEIMKMIPHREPMLLIDRVEKTGETTAKGAYTVKGDEWFLKGHFPGNPVVPGVILCEIMAQACCILIGNKINGRTPYYTGLDKVRFKHTVLPGDTLTVECSLTKERGPFCFASAKGYVGEQLAVSGELSFALVGG